MSGVNLGRVRDIHRLMDIAGQPGGLKTISDAELVALAQHVRGRLSEAEASKRGKKARRGWRETVERAEAELARRDVEGAPGRPPRVWSTNEAMRQGERDLALQAPRAYERTIKDRQQKKGASATAGRASRGSSKEQVARQTPRPKSAL
jgi:hypothetical protein